MLLKKAKAKFASRHGLKACGDLSTLLREVLFSYKKEVLGEGKLHNLFAKDFLNSHYYTDRRDVQGLNEHRKNFGILEGLLVNREDLLRRFSCEEPGDELLQNLLRLYYTTTPPPQGIRASSVDFAIKNQKRPLSLGCHLSDEQLELIVQCVNEAHLFEEVIDTSIFRSLLEGRLSTPLQSHNNRQLAFFFDQMCRNGLILSRWQHLLGQAGSILGPKDRMPLRHTQYANALTHAKSNPNSMQEKIRQFILQVKLKSENTDMDNK